MIRKQIYRGVILDKLIITACKQRPEAPFIDGCMTMDGDGVWYKGYALFIDFYKRYAIVIAWRKI